MRKKILAYIEENDLLEKSRPILVAVSGGLDSVSILHFLKDSGYEVICAHFNHKLRPASDADALFVHKLAQKLKLLHVEGEGDVQAFCSDHGLSIEEAARIMRYGFLFRQAAQVNAQAIVTGHTADDQVETVLMHLLRGAGLNGLKGMLPKTVLSGFDFEIPVVRPLLTTWRRELKYAGMQLALEYIEDETNEDLTFFRNRLRHELIPFLETFNPKIRRIIHRTAKTLSNDESLLSELTNNAWDQLIAALSSNFIRLDLVGIRGLHEGMQARLVRKAIAVLRPGLRDVDQETISRSLKLINSERTTGQEDLVDHLKIFIEYHDLWIAKSLDDLPGGEWPQISSDKAELTIGSEFQLRGGWVISGVYIDHAPDNWRSVGQDKFYLDIDKLDEPLIIRGRKPGERFFPLGLDGRSTRVSEVMINLKIPKRLRDGWPLLVSGDQIIWICGRQVSQFGLISPTSKRILEISLYRR